MGSIADRVAALNLSQVGKGPVRAPQPPSYEQAVRNASPAASTTRSRPPPPPPPRPALPARPSRPQSTSVPPTQDQGISSKRVVGNQPEAPAINGNARPPLPTRTSTQTSQGPSLPPRRPSEQPSLPSRRPSEAPPAIDRSRRGSTDSMSSVATTRSSVSAISTATSFTSQGDRYRVKAPEFDAASLPALPPKRTKEEKEAADRKYAGLRPLRQTKSTPKVDQIGKETTPPPPPKQTVIPPVLAREVRAEQERRGPPLPSRTPKLDDSSQASARREPLPPPRPRVSALSWGMNTANNTPPSLPTEGFPASQTDGAPPPIPVTSKPDLAALQASKPKLSGSSDTSSQIKSLAPSAPVEITSVTHFSQILRSSAVVIADFYADYCGPCKNIAPAFNQLCSQYSRPGEVIFVKINRPAREDLYSQYGVQAMPTFLFFKNGEEVDRMVGASKEGLEYSIENLIHEISRNDVPQPQISAPGPGSCLHCRDFSSPDNHAARFPREAIPSSDLGWLAHQLTSPFPSHTDKARAIFTWLHHNIMYDTVAFFGNNIKPSTPQSTLQSGLAVCEGYAGLFSAIALKAGLEAMVVTGHGKGYGHSDLKPGDPLPQYDGNHAWNAVRIDGGEWKLIDCCWGAGYSNGPHEGYKKRFAPERFTQTNNDFGLDHFPGDSGQQFRTDGRRIQWEEYILGNKSGCGATFFTGFVSEEGLSSRTFQPTTGTIATAQQGPTVRFAFQKVCPHWDPVRCGKGPYFLYVLHLQNLDGTQRNHIPFETNGEVWWCDVPVRDLGRPGHNAQIYTVTSFDGKDGRGLTIDEYRRRKGRVGYGFGGVCKWEIV